MVTEDFKYIVTEDYVSFELAKLLKSKKFHIPTRSHYDGRGGFGFLDICEIDWNYYKCFRERRCYSAPTLQMAMKWLREVYDIFIEIRIDGMRKDIVYKWTLYSTSTKEIRHYSGWGRSYEETAETALKYCLENL